MQKCDVPQNNFITQRAATTDKGKIKLSAYTTL
jgi:hypothetical protein